MAHQREIYRWQEYSKCPRRERLTLFAASKYSRRADKWTCVCANLHLRRQRCWGNAFRALCFQVRYIFGGLLHWNGWMESHPLYEWDAAACILSGYMLLLGNVVCVLRKLCAWNVERGAIGRQIEFNRKTSSLVLITSTLRSMVFRAAQPEPINFLSARERIGELTPRNMYRVSAVSIYYSRADNKSLDGMEPPSAFYPPAPFAHSTKLIFGENFL